MCIIELGILSVCVSIHSNASKSTLYFYIRCVAIARQPCQTILLDEERLIDQDVFRALRGVGGSSTVISSKCLV